jgi:hypothetical protein
MTTLKWLASASLALATFPASYAESHFPGNVTSLRLRLVQRSQIVVPVKINHTGPYDFLVDTGAQVTIVDPALLSRLSPFRELQLRTGEDFPACKCNFDSLNPAMPSEPLQVVKCAEHL